MNNDNILRGIALILVVTAFAFVLSTCGGGKRGMNPPSIGSGGQPDGLVNFQAAEGMGSLEAAPPTETSLDEALGELNAYPCPEGVDEALFEELKDALGEALNCRAGGLSPAFFGAPLGTRPTGIKFASTPPDGDANRVDDLELIENGGTYTLSWHYINSGDYDQNGTVGISDITPIAMHYGETYEPEDVDCLLAVIDGSGNNVVDIADITPIAMYYSTDCAGYRIQRGDSPPPDGQFSSFKEVAFADATGDGRLFFSTELLSVSQPYLRVVPYDAEGIPGEPSEPVFVSIPGDPPEITSVSPTSGMEGESVEFSAIVNGTSPFDYSWNFDGGAEPNTPVIARPTVTLQAASEYDASLTVSNDFGENTYPFTLTVTEETTYSVSGHVEIDTGGGLQGVTLTLTPGNYPATTNSGGDYTITDVPNGNYTLTPTLVDWTFEPPTLSVAVSDGNVTDKDFIATDGGGGDDCMVSGHVEKYTGGGLQDVTLTLTPGGYSDITDADGNYEITDVPEGWYTLTPVLAGWSFAPPTLDVEATPTSATPYFFLATSDT